MSNKKRENLKHNHSLIVSLIRKMKQNGLSFDDILDSHKELSYFIELYETEEKERIHRENEIKRIAEELYNDNLIKIQNEFYEKCEMEAQLLMRKKKM